MGALAVAEFVDRGQSGRNTDRPELRQMFAYLKDHPIDYVIVHKLDGLARSRADDIEITQVINKSGVQLISSTEGIDTSASGVLLRGIIASIAEFRFRNLRQEVMNWMRQKVLQGGTPSRAPIGYLNVRVQTEDDREARTVRVAPECAPHIAWEFEMYAAGEWSVGRLIEIPGEGGLRTRPSLSRSLAIPKTASLHKVLKNSCYKGIVTVTVLSTTARTNPLFQPHPGTPPEPSGAKD